MPTQTVAEFQNQQRLSDFQIQQAVAHKPLRSHKLRADTKTAVILAMFADGHTRSEIAKAVGVRYQMVYQVVDKYLGDLVGEALLLRCKELLGNDFEPNR